MIICQNTILQDHHFSFYLPAQRHKGCFCFSAIRDLLPLPIFSFSSFFFPACVCVLANSICIINSNSTCQARCSATLTLCSFSTAFPQERLYRLLVASTEMATDIPVPSYVLFIRLQICHDNSLGKSQTALTGALSLWTSRRTASCGHCTISVQVLSITPNECALEFLSLKTTQIRMKRDSACQEFILIL